jgi:triosephosphate isomerase
MTDRRLFVAGNWKMHHGPRGAAQFTKALLSQDLPAAPEVVICPPFVSLPSVVAVADGARVAVGAQNVHWEDTGAFTGEISPAMLLEIGVRWVIVGHSERRSLFGETDATAARRAAHAQTSGLDVIYCVGESLDERDAGDTLDVLDRQTAAMVDLNPDRLVLAYEPVWAIGTGRTATPEQAQEAQAFLRSRLAGLFTAADAERIRVVYGGSLKPGNAHQLLSQPDVDGGLIGGASLDVASFSAIIRAAADCAAGE